VAQYNQQIIGLSKAGLYPKLAKPQGGIALYPINTTGSTLSVNVTSTTIVVTYISSSTHTGTINYTNTSVEDVCLAINQLGYPVKAIPLITNTILAADDLVATGSSIPIPSGFTINDRLADNGIILRTKKLSVRQKSLSQIRVLQPYLDAATLPWYPRIQVGSFAQSTNGRVYYFAVPEYNTQTWSIKYGRPFRDINGEQPYQYSANAIRLARTPILSVDEVYRYDTPLPKVGIDGIDTNNGIVYFKSPVDATTLRITYSYKEESFEYRDVNINCHFQQNPLLIGKTVVLYALPYKGNNTILRKKTIYHSVGNNIAEAISSIVLDGPSTPIAIIGAYSVQQVYGSDKIKILDTRVYGGGLKSNDGPTSPVYEHDPILESDEPKIENIYSESNSFWDIGRWDGEIYPGAAAVLIDLPSDLKDTLSLDDIKVKATKFLAAGVLPLFEFSNRDLPDVTGWSSQVSCFDTGNVGEEGHQILPLSYQLPGKLTDASWPNEYTRDIPMVSGEVISPTTSNGVYIPYLKSSPIAGIEWEERNYTFNSDAPNGEYTYTPWKTKRYFDTREVANHQLIKSNIVLDTNKAGTQYRNIKIHSPFHREQYSYLKDRIGTVLDEITATIDSKTDVPYGPIRYTFSDIATLDTQLVSLYYGLHPAYKYYNEILNSDKSGTYLDRFINTYAQLTNGIDAYKNILPYDAESGQYISLVSGVSGINIGENIIPIARVGQIIKESYGTSSILYSSALSVITGYISNLYNTTVQTIDTSISYPYPTLTYTYLGNGSYTGELLNLAELHGYGFADVSSVFEDHKYLKNNVALATILRCLPSPTGDIAMSLASLFSGHHDLVQNLEYKFSRTFSDLLTKDGLPLVNTWFTKHDRLGEYAGTICTDLIQAYEEIYSTISAHAYTGTYQLYGADISGLSDYFSTITSLLNHTQDSLTTILNRGGHLNSEVANLIYGYGWYIQNRTAHYALCSGVEDSNYSTTYSGVYRLGINALIKSMITTDGKILETDYIDYTPAPFVAQTPSLIFNALLPGIGIDPSVYLPITAAVFNTLTGNYYRSGLFYADPRMISSAAGGEVDVSYYLAKLYRSL